ncbi:MAG: GTPase [Clostridia bacterium]|nr:GTPase [Clostridia bacterium]
MANKKEIPVYLFTGFLESGKTRLIQETMEDERFNAGESTLILLCEEGVEELDLSRFPHKNVFLQTVESEEELTKANLAAYAEKAKAERVVVEYNGMWMLDLLYNALPENWLVYQEFMLADATTFLTYNANMRQLTVDKLQSCEVIVFNRYHDGIDKNELHKIVRGSTRKAAIGYEYKDGSFEQDTIEDPLPYDLSADIVVIRDEDYAFFYRDLSEEMEKYVGKTLCFKGIVARDKSLPDTQFVVGRHVMTCCEADITYRALAVKAKERVPLATRDWVTVTGRIVLEYHKIYRMKGPVLEMISCDYASKPEKEVATFF